MFADLVKKIDVFVERYARPDASSKGFKADLLELVQTAVEHGEAKDKNKITGILVNGIKAFMGGKKDE
jgi:hypothetical protein